MLRSFFGFITKFHRIFSNTFKAVREEDKDQKKTKGRASSRDSKKDQKKKKKKKKKGRASSRESIALCCGLLSKGPKGTLAPRTRRFSRALWVTRGPRVAHPSRLSVATAGRVGI
ncbi:hypothetical protein BHM03_00022778 [Ensete ventricosum]|nr:hypothetical protein BHM03_00022778 [Ensete ventricosum]